MTIAGIYYILNLKSKRVYVGSSVDIDHRFTRHKRELRNNKHHNIQLQRAWNKYGESSFKFGVLEIIMDIKKLLTEEQAYIDINVGGYNMAPAGGGDLLTNHPNREDILVRRSETLKKLYSSMTAEEKTKRFRKYGDKNGMFGRTHTDEVKKQSSIKNKGNKYCVGFVHNSETRKKISDHAKTRIGEKNPFFNKTHTAETKQKLASSTKIRFEEMTVEDRINHNKIRFVEIDDIIYAGVSNAAKHLETSSAIICYRIKSHHTKYSGYSYVDDVNYLNANIERIII